MYDLSASVFIPNLVHSLLTPLHYAAREGHSVTVERICLLHKLLAAEDHLPWINALDQYAACASAFRLRSFIFACFRPVRFVIAPNSVGSTSLDLAARWGHLETVRVLLRHGATVFKVDLLDKISRKAQRAAWEPSDDPLDSLENWNAISFELRRAL